jgi:hypothetical protein
MQLQIHIDCEKLVEILNGFETNSQDEPLTPREADLFPGTIYQRKNGLGYSTRTVDALQKAIWQFLSQTRSEKLVEIVLLILKQNPDEYSHLAEIIEDIHLSIQPTN